MRREVAVTCALLPALGVSLPALGAELLPQGLKEVGVTEHLGERVDLDFHFTDEDGGKVRLGDLFVDGSPVLLTLNYYRCTMLCDIQLKNLVETLRQLDWSAGEQFRLVTVSIDPREAPDLAKGKQKTLLDSYDRAQSAWRFLVSPDNQVQKLADQVGFHYRYDKDKDQYAHAAVLFALSADGMIARYVYGLSYQPRDIKFSLMEASAGRTASTVDKIILSCFHYDAESGRYAPYAFGIMRLGGGVTLLLLGALLVFLWRFERRRKKAHTQ